METILIFGFLMLMQNGGQNTAEHEVIKPTESHECVVVTKGLNMSVDCWPVK